MLRDVATPLTLPSLFLPITSDSFRHTNVRRYKEKKEAAEPEADPERDQRTLFAYQMPLKVTERDVYEFFSKAGKIWTIEV